MEYNSSKDLANELIFNIEAKIYKSSKEQDTSFTRNMIYNEKALEDRLSEFKNSFVHPEFKTQIIYASKAFSCEAMLKLVKKEG